MRRSAAAHMTALAPAAAGGATRPPTGLTPPLRMHGSTVGGTRAQARRAANQYLRGRAHENLLAEPGVGGVGAVVPDLHAVDAPDASEGRDELQVHHAPALVQRCVRNACRAAHQHQSTASSRSSRTRLSPPQPQAATRAQTQQARQQARAAGRGLALVGGWRFWLSIEADLRAPPGMQDAGCRCGADARVLQGNACATSAEGARPEHGWRRHLAFVQSLGE